MQKQNFYLNQIEDKNWQLNYKMTFTILSTISNRENPKILWQETQLVEDCNLFEAIEDWASTIANSEMLGKIKPETLLKKIKNLEEEYINVWEFYFNIGKFSIWVTIVKTVIEPDKYFDEDEALDYIFTNLPQDFSGQFSKKDIELILTIEVEFLKKIGIAKSKYNRSVIQKHEIDDETEDKKVLYIQEKALKFHKKHFQDDFIEDILDLEFQYMENMGLVFYKKLKLFGLEFNQPDKN